MKFFNSQNKNLLGQTLFILSILVFAYMIITPLTHMITNIDEFFTLTISNFPLLDIINITKGDFNPPLYYLLSKLAVKFLGNIDTLFALKTLSIIPYFLILAVSAIKIRKDYGWLTAGLFVFSIGVMSEFFTYFLMVRMYGWAILFTLLTFIFFKDILTKDDKISWILFTISALLAAYTHYFAGLTVAVIYIFLLMHIVKNNNDKVKNWAASAIIPIILFAPWTSSLFKQIQALNPLQLPKTDLDLIITSFGYFANGDDVLISLISILVLIVLGVIYFTYLKEDKDQFYIISGFGVFIATILIGIIVSIIYKPVLITSSLLFASAILWLVISILISKIENDRTFLISFALITLLLISGVGTMIYTSNESYNINMPKNDVLNQITEDDNAIVILANPRASIYFLNLANDVDTYCINQDYIYGEKIDTVHEIFDFKDLNENGIDDLITNNSDKNIYLITYGDFDLENNIQKEALLKEGEYEISKISLKESEETY